MSRRHSMENLELMKLTPDKMNVRTSLLSVFTLLLKPDLFQVWTRDNWMVCVLQAFVCSYRLLIVHSCFIEGSEVEQRHPDQTVQTVSG